MFVRMQVSPADTYELLTTEWGVRHHLATALIERCGGHLHDISQTLSWLRCNKKYATALSWQSSNNLHRCLRSVADDPVATAEMVRILTELARTGFSAVEDETDPMIEKISSHYVGELVNKGSTICGFDYKSRWESWTGRLGFVPAQQSMRLTIAKELYLLGLLK